MKKWFQLPWRASLSEEELETAAWLHEQAQGLTAAFAVQPGKARLLRALQREQSDWQPAFRRARLWRQSLQWTLLVLLCFNLSSVGLKLSQSALLSLPGDILYPLKRGVESARLALAVGDMRTAALYIEYTTERSNELEELLLEGRYEYLDDSVDRLAQSVSQANAALSGLSGQAAAAPLEQELQETLAVRAVVFNSLAAAAPSAVRENAAQVWQAEAGENQP